MNIRWSAIGELLRRLWRQHCLCRAKNQGIFYINGPDTLPTPLTPEQEKAAVERLADDPAARDLLIEHNLRLVVFIAKRFENTGIGIEDLISIGTVGLIKAINTFRAEKNIKLATYASRCIENEVLMYIRKNSAQRGQLSMDEPLGADKEGSELYLSDILGSDEPDIATELAEREERQAIRDCVGRLNARERTIIELRYGLRGDRELTQKEVADLLGISQSYISRLEKRILARMKGELERL